MGQVELTELDYSEAARYMGYKGNIPDDNIKCIMAECEKEIIENAVPRYLYKRFPIRATDAGIEVCGTNMTLPGNSIKIHLKDCDECYLVCGTLSIEIDKLIRITELKDMAKALIMDTMSSVAIEQVMEKVEMLIHHEIPNKKMTYRYGVGYGDLPITLEGDFLKVLNAQKTIGLCSSDSHILSPRKSVVCIIGVTDKDIPMKKISCNVCTMQGRCEFRKRGDRCGF